MTRGQMEKAEFVMNCVEPMLAGIDPRISSVNSKAALAYDVIKIFL